MNYICYAKGVEQFNVNNESLGIGDDRALYYAKSVGKHRIYRSGYPIKGNKDFELFKFKSEKQAEKLCKQMGENFTPLLID